MCNYHTNTLATVKKLNSQCFIATIIVCTEQGMSTLRSSVGTDRKMKEDYDKVIDELTETKIDIAAESATDQKGKLVSEATPPSSPTPPPTTHNETTSTEDETLEDPKQDDDDTSDGTITCTDDNVQIVNSET